MFKQPVISLHWKGFYFTPKLISILLFLILFSVLIKLGFWQIHRAEFKRNLLRDYKERPLAKPLQLNQLQGDSQKLQYYPIEVSGYYDTEHMLLLDNKSYQHQLGYHVLTPFLLTNHRVLLVNRGWVARSENPQQLPKFAMLEGQQTIRGLIYLPKKTFLLGPEFNKISWPLVSQAIDIPALAKLLQQNFYPFVVLLAPDQNNGFIREWNPITTTPYKNIGYAVQWFALAGTLLILFIVVNTRRESHDQRRCKSKTQ